MLLRQPVKTVTHVIELLNFVHECMGHAAFASNQLRGGPFIEAPRYTADNPCYAATAT